MRSSEPFQAQILYNQTKHLVPIVHQYLTSTSHLVDLAELMEVALAREDRKPQQELRRDAAHRPDVHAGAVGLGAEEELRTAVPAGDDLERWEWLRLMGDNMELQRY